MHSQSCENVLYADWLIFVMIHFLENYQTGTCYNPMSVPLKV